MIKIFLDKDIKKQFEKEGLSYPYLKSTKKWGVRGSTLLDTNSLEKAEINILNYLSKQNLIKIYNTEKPKIVGYIDRDCPVCGEFKNLVCYEFENTTNQLCEICFHSKFRK